MPVNIWDADGCWVLGFKMGYNEAENAIRLRKQPLCTQFCKYSQKRGKDAINYLVTGRKNFSLGDITRKIVEKIHGKNCSVFLFPDHEKYENYHSWKILIIEEIISSHPNEEINIYDDDEKIVRYFARFNNLNVFWVSSDLNGFFFKEI